MNKDYEYFNYDNNYFIYTLNGYIYKPYYKREFVIFRPHNPKKYSIEKKELDKIDGSTKGGVISFGYDYFDNSLWFYTDFEISSKQELFKLRDFHKWRIELLLSPQLEQHVESVQLIVNGWIILDQSFSDVKFRPIQLPDNRTLSKYDLKFQQFVQRSSFHDFDYDRSFLRVNLFRETPLKTKKFPSPGFDFYKPK